jgi:hypothetical protein
MEYCIYQLLHRSNDLLFHSSVICILTNTYTLTPQYLHTNMPIY